LQLAEPVVVLALVSLVLRFGMCCVFDFYPWLAPGILGVADHGLMIGFYRFSQIVSRCLSKLFFFSL